MWCDKYKPKNIEDLIISPNDKKVIIKWMKDMLKGKAKTAGGAILLVNNQKNKCLSPKKLYLENA